MLALFGNSRHAPARLRRRRSATIRSAVALALGIALAGCDAAKPRDGEPADLSAGASETVSEATSGGAIEGRSLLGRELRARTGGDRKQAESDLQAARDALARNPDNAEAAIWVGRRLGYLWRMRDAIAVYTDVIRRHPENPAALRHRGHRFISLRRFDEAIDDLERAARLIVGKPDPIEPDGQPNAKNEPRSTLGFNIWYHLALAHYLKGNFAGAAVAHEELARYADTNDDKRVSATYWHYLTLRRLRSEEDARKLLANISADMDVIENHGYHALLLMFKGERTPEQVLADAKGDSASVEYGVAMYRLLSGESASARAALEKLAAREDWPAFGVIAAEAELARDRR